MMTVFDTTKQRHNYVVPLYDLTLFYASMVTAITVVLLCPLESYSNNWFY